MATPAADAAAGATPDGQRATGAAHRELDALAREAARLRREASQARAGSTRSARALLDVEQQLALAKAHVAALEALAAERGETAAALRSRLDRAQRVSNAMQASISWQITAPLRAIKRRA